MAKPYVAPPSPAAIVERRVWALVTYFGKKFPGSSIKVEVEYNPYSKYCVEHKGEKK